MGGGGQRAGHRADGARSRRRRGGGGSTTRRPPRWCRPRGRPGRPSPGPRRRCGAPASGPPAAGPGRRRRGCGGTPGRRRPGSSRSASGSPSSRTSSRQPPPSNDGPGELPGRLGLVVEAEDGRGGAPPQHPAAGVEPVGEPVEPVGGPAAPGRPGPHPQRRLGDDAERALAADEDLAEVGPGRRPGVAAGAEPPAPPVHHLETDHHVLDLPVPGGVLTGTPAGQPAADGRDGHRLRPVPEGDAVGRPGRVRGRRRTCRGAPAAAATCRRRRRCRPGRSGRGRHRRRRGRRRRTRPTGRRPG